MPPTLKDDSPFAGRHDEVDYVVLDRYFAGECSDAETARIRAWIAARPERSIEVERLRAVWQAGAGARPDVEAALRRVTGRQPTRAQPLAALDHRRRRQISRLRRRGVGATTSAQWLAPVAGLFATFVVCFVVGARHLGVSRHQTRDREYVTAAGQRETVTLPDGTQFTLAPGSRLDVPVDYGAVSRAVRLEGEGFFVVAHDDRHPLVIHTANAVVTDVGTRFDVRWYAGDEAVRIAVAEGRVTLTAPSPEHTLAAKRRTETVALGPDDLATVASDGTTAVTRGANVAALTAWTAGHLVFAKLPLPIVLAELSRWYGVTITVADSALRARHVSATIDQPSAAAALDLLAPAVGASYVSDGQTLVLTPLLRRPATSLP